MKFIYDNVPDLTIVNENKPLFEIKSVILIDEQKDKVILKCAENVDSFKRGFTCDLICHYHICDENEEQKEKRSEVIYDLVLVHVNKIWDVNIRPSFEYVFFK